MLRRGASRCRAQLREPAVAPGASAPGALSEGGSQRFRREGLRQRSFRGASGGPFGGGSPKIAASRAFWALRRARQARKSWEEEGVGRSRTVTDTKKLQTRLAGWGEGWPVGQEKTHPSLRNYGFVLGQRQGRLRPFRLSCRHRKRLVKSRRGCPLPLLAPSQRPPSGLPSATGEPSLHSDASQALPRHSNTAVATARLILPSWTRSANHASAPEQPPRNLFHLLSQWHMRPA